jgi:hypothetical protein
MELLHLKLELIYLPLLLQLLLQAGATLLALLSMLCAVAAAAAAAVGAVLEH